MEMRYYMVSGAQSRKVLDVKMHIDSMVRLRDRNQASGEM